MTTTEEEVLGETTATSPAGVGRLTSLTVPVDSETASAFRSLALRYGSALEHDGRSVTTLGIAATLELQVGLSDPLAVREIGRRLADLAGADATANPIAIGSLPFDRSAAARLTIPRFALVATPDGRALLTTVGDDLEDLLALSAAWTSHDSPLRGIDHGEAAAPLADLGVEGVLAGAELGGSPDSFVLESSISHDDFRALVASAVGEIRSGALDKVVLVREVVVRANRSFSAGVLVERLRALYPSCAAFSIDGFIGASPELLISRDGRDVRSHPLAGTVGRSGDPATDARLEAALLGSAKEREEHHVVVEAVSEALAPVCESLDVPDGPSIVELRNVSHLGTHISGTIREGLDSPTALDLVARLHPTPAVAGTPREAALQWLAAHEGLDRGPYAGPVGWMDARGDGEWYVGIRAATIEGSEARLFAGVGVVADSDPDSELAETQFKLQAILAAAVRP